MIPIGSVIAWDKSLAGVPNLPDGFVECNGQVLVDATSPLNGQTIRNLNGANKFLRGNSSSGGVGGSATHTHSFSADTGIEDSDTLVHGLVADTGVAGLGHTHSVAGTTAAGSSNPSYVDMVWIMRVR